MQTADILRALYDGTTRDQMVAHVLNLPTKNQIPRPGEARAWEFADWVAWGKPWGFLEREQTTHNYVIQHKDIPMLRFGIATSTGDIRSRMNFASDVRVHFQHRVPLFRYAIELAISRGAEVDALYQAACDILASGEAQKGYDVGTENVTGNPAPVWHKIYKQATREKTSPRHIVSMCMSGGYAAENSETIYTAVSKGVPLPISVIRSLHTAIDDYIEIFDTLREEERAKKQAAREADLAVNPLAPAEEPQPEMAEPEQDLLTDVRRAIEALERHMEHTAAKDQRIADLVLANTALRKTAKDAQDRVAALQAARDAAFSNAAAAEAKTAALVAEHAAAQQLIAESANVKNWKPAFEALVDSVAAHLHSSDFLALAAGVSHARAELATARAALAADAP